MSARYRGVGVRLDDFLGNLQRYFKDAGWSVKKVVPGQASFSVEVEKGFFDDATVRVRGSPEDVTVDLDDDGDLMGLVEQALAESCSSPAAIVGWREQERQSAMGNLQGFLGVPGAQSTSNAEETPETVQAITTRAQAAPKLEACMHCGAPLRYDPEEALVICGYCGFINNVSGGQPPRYSMLSQLVDALRAVELAKDHVGKGVFLTRAMADKAEWGSPVLRYVPNWAVMIRLYGTLQGRRALIKTKDVRGQVAQEIATDIIGGVLGGFLGGRRVDVRRTLDRVETINVDETIDVTVVARRAAQFQPDAGAYRIPLERKEPYRKTGIETLNVEMGADDAVERAKGLAIQDLRSRYTFVSSFNVSASPVGEPELVYAPWWFMEYKMNGDPFNVIVDACSGDIVVGNRPMIPT